MGITRGISNGLVCLTAGCVCGATAEPAAWAADKVSQAVKAEIYVLSPVNLETGKVDLGTLEDSTKATYSYSESLNWTDLEDRIGAEIKKAIPSGYSGKAVCATILCPDISFDIEFKSSFKFISTPDPGLSSSSDAADNWVKVKAKPKARIGLVTRIKTKSSLGDKSHSIDAYVDISASLESKLKLWPKLDVDAPKLSLKIEDSNLDLQDTRGAFKLAGMQIGSLLAAMPELGLAGPLLPFIGIIGGNEAAKKVQDEVNKQFRKALDKELRKAEAKLESELAAAIAPAVKEARDLKSELLKRKIPNSKETIKSFLDRADGELDVRTRATSTRVTVVATVRLGNDKGKGAIQGAIQLPKKACSLASTPLIKLASLSSVNGSLAGKSCSSLFKTTDLERKLYLGGNPEKYLKSDSDSNDLDTWKSVGGLKLTGKAVDRGSYVECAYFIEDLPDSGIVEFRVRPDSNLAKLMYDYKDAAAGRFLFAVEDKTEQTAILDSKAKPFSVGTLNVGGPGPASTADCKGQGFISNYNMHLSPKMLDSSITHLDDLLVSPAALKQQLNSPAILLAP